MGLKQISFWYGLIITFFYFSKICESEFNCFTWIKELFRGHKYKIRETLNSQEALCIYIDHGANNCVNICATVNDRTNQVFAEALCRHALAKLHPKESITQRVTCTFPIPIEGVKPCQIKNYSMPKNMARCPFNKDKSFYILNGPKPNFYYIIHYAGEPGVIRRGVVGNIIACLHIVVNKKTDFSTVRLQETLDPLVADDIFGFYGSIINNSKNSKAHLCMGRPVNLKVTDICHKAANSAYFNSKIKNSKQIIDGATICIRKIIERQIFALKYDKNIQKGGELMVKCAYYQGLNLQTFMVLNGPTEEFFYILEDYNNSEGIWKAKIVACVKIPIKFEP